MMNKEKEFDAVDFMRSKRQILNELLSTMTKEQIVEYFKQKRNRRDTIKPCS